jgi:3D (Asp-Asp-Asp) domain-containing protein
LLFAFLFSEAKNFENKKELKVENACYAEYPSAGIAKTIYECFTTEFNYDSDQQDEKIEVEKLEVEIEKSEQIEEYILVESTAYCNNYNSVCADGTIPFYGVVAGKIEWLGKVISIYECNEDESVGEFIGYFCFHDTGYGQDTGYGESRVLEGRNLGTIETGECIDIFMDEEQDCINYGRRKVYIKFI